MSIQQHEELIKSLYSKYSYITLWNVVEWKALVINTDWLDIQHSHGYIWKGFKEMIRVLRIFNSWQNFNKIRALSRTKISIHSWYRIRDNLFDEESHEILDNKQWKLNCSLMEYKGRVVRSRVRWITSSIVVAIISFVIHVARDGGYTEISGWQVPLSDARLDR